MSLYCRWGGKTAGCRGNEVYATLSARYGLACFFIPLVSDVWWRRDRRRRGEPEPLQGSLGCRAHHLWHMKNTVLWFYFLTTSIIWSWKVPRPPLQFTEVSFDFFWLSTVLYVEGLGRAPSSGKLWYSQVPTSSEWVELKLFSLCPFF